MLFAAVAAFVFVAGGLVLLFPGPRRDTDYLVIGTLATFATLMTIFVVVITGVFKQNEGVFFKRRNLT